MKCDNNWGLLKSVFFRALLHYKTYTYVSFSSSRVFSISFIGQTFNSSYFAYKISFLDIFLIFQAAVNTLNILFLQFIKGIYFKILCLLLLNVITFRTFCSLFCYSK